MNEKRNFIQKLIIHLTSELKGIELSAKVAHEAATNEESKAEDQYDTRGLESSYLASAQALRGEELKKQIQFFSMSQNETHKLITLKEDDEENEVLFFLTKYAGGTKIDNITVITPESPVGSQLMDRAKNDSLEMMYKGKKRDFTVTEIL